MRIAILGNAGAGKSTLAVKLAQKHMLPYHEIDAFLWQPGWVAAPKSDYLARHREILASEAWILDGLGHLDGLADRLDRASHIILCDLPLWQHFWLLSERQLAWERGTLDTRPGQQTDMPPTKVLFQTVWQIEHDWMPNIRKKVAKAQSEPGSIVHVINSIEALTRFDLNS